MEVDAKYYGVLIEVTDVVEIRVMWVNYLCGIVGTLEMRSRFLILSTRGW
jgi:hypothetical protein